MDETKTCSNCKNWKAGWQSLYGECKLLEYESAYGYEYSINYLDTEPDFGCTKFEPKGDLNG